MNSNIEPSVEGIKKLVGVVEDDQKVSTQEQALTHLFTKTYPNNDDILEITIKVSALNTLYSTQLHKYLFPVVNHLKNLSIDERLKNGDITLIDDIIQTPLEDGKIYRCYSFATKYCSFHRPDAYPIYDSYVDRVLVYLQARDKFAGDMVIDNKNYLSYVQAIKKFQAHYQLNNFSLKQIDKYLWQLGYELVKQ